MGKGLEQERTPKEDSFSSLESPTSVRALAASTVTSDEIDLSSLELNQIDDKELEFLTSQTERTLNRHVGVQQNQRQQAVRILQATIGITGVLVTAFPFVNSFLQSLNFPEAIPAWRSVLSLLTVILISALGQEVAADIYNIVEISFDILSPEETKRGAVGTILAMMNFIRPTEGDKEARGGIRSVSILDELAPAIDTSDVDFQERVVCNRLNRIRRNEKVIDQNIDHLYNIYQRAKLALERGVAIVFLVLTTLILLGARTG